MRNVEKIFSEMRETVHNGPVAIKKLRESGRKVVGVYCNYTPWELISAAGAIPVALCSTSEKPIAAAERHLPRNLCPLIKASYGHALTDTCHYFHFCDLVVGETTCDGKKKMYELLGELRPLHIMQLPQEQDGSMSLKLWRHEMDRLRERLEVLCGVKITDKKLSDAIAARNAVNKTALRFFNLATLPDPVVGGKEIMLVSDYLRTTFDDEKGAALVHELTEALLNNYIDGERRRDSFAHRILITGCPMGESLEKVVDALESESGDSVVVGFENCGSLKCYGFSAEETGDPMDALAKKYLSIPCSVMSPNEGRKELLLEYVRKYRADGVIDVILQACHTYAVESYTIRRFLAAEGVPYMAVETDYSQGDTGQLSTRFQAFAEIL